MLFQDSYTGELHNGKVYVYTYDATASSWALSSTITGSAADDSCFGASVDISDTEANIIVGAPFEGTSEEGAVYHFIRDPSDPTEWATELFPTEANDVTQATANAHYGHAVAMDAYDRAVIGLPGADGNVNGIDYTQIGKGTAWRFNEIETEILNSM